MIETYDKLAEFFGTRNNNRIYIHKSGIYDIFLFVVVMPVFLYAFYRFEVSNPYFIDQVPKITIIAVYIYSFLAISLIGRLLFQYARWLFPLVEYTTDKRWVPNTQRAFLITIIVGIASAAIYDAIKFFLI